MATTQAVRLAAEAFWPAGHQVGVYVEGGALSFVSSWRQLRHVYTPAGRFQMQILGAVVEFERGMIRERVVTGLARAKAQGVRLGRRRALRCLKVRKRQAPSCGIECSTAIVIRDRERRVVASVTVSPDGTVEDDTARDRKVFGLPPRARRFSVVCHAKAEASYQAEGREEGEEGQDSQEARPGSAKVKNDTGERAASGVPLITLRRSQTLSAGPVLPQALDILLPGCAAHPYHTGTR